MKTKIIEKILSVKKTVLFKHLQGVFIPFKMTKREKREKKTKKIKKKRETKIAEMQQETPTQKCDRLFKSLLSGVANILLNTNFVLKLSFFNGHRS